MVKRIAIIRNGVVENVASVPDDWTGADGEWRLPAEASAIEAIEASPGWTYDGKMFSAPPPEPAYRERRKAAYISELGNGNPTFEETTGDVLDAIIKHIYGDTIELDALATKIAAIKAANPKPQ
tara:strand:- start:57 stop:428 length:372 start_codon:yes stop_codon:yes gene_type:complete